MDVGYHIRDTILFGIGDYGTSEWASIIFEMLGNRLDKLCLSHESVQKDTRLNVTGGGFSELVEVNDAYAFLKSERIQRIPKLGKRIWFEASSGQLLFPINSERRVQDFIAKLQRSIGANEFKMEIKHVSREHEPF